MLPRFTSTHTRSVMYQLTSPSLRPKMKEEKIYLNRFQTKYDRRIFKLCQSLRERQLVKAVFVNKNHLTSIIREEDAPPNIIYDLEMIPTLFHQNPNVLHLLTKFRQSDPGEDDDEEVTGETLDQSTSGSRIVDVD